MLNMTFSTPLAKQHSTTLKNYSNLCLVASPTLKDDYFDQSVIYIIQHDKQGAMGLMLNQSSAIPMSDLLGQLDINHHKNINRHVLNGGPVQPEVGFVLHKGTPFWSSSFEVQAPYCVTTSKDILQAIARNEGVFEFEMILGYAGWHSGQLEEEIRRGDWFLCPASDALLFKTPYDKRWFAALSDAGVNTAWLADEVGHA